MFDIFAQGTPTDPTGYYFTQGVLGVTVVVLALTLIYIYKSLSAKIDKKEEEKTAILEAWRQEVKTDGKEALEIVKGNSQTMFYFADKIQAGKGNQVQIQVPPNQQDRQL